MYYHEQSAKYCHQHMPRCQTTQLSFIVKTGERWTSFQSSETALQSFLLVCSLSPPHSPLPSILPSRNHVSSLTRMRLFLVPHHSYPDTPFPVPSNSKTVNCFSILAFLSCLVQLALTVKINENYIKIQRYQQRTPSVS